jgi:hypothetical protein
MKNCTETITIVSLLALSGCGTTRPIIVEPAGADRFQGVNLIAEKAFMIGVNVGLELADERQTNATLNVPVRAYEIKNNVIEYQETNGVFDGLEFKTNAWEF